MLHWPGCTLLLFCIFSYNFIGIINMLSVLLSYWTQSCFHMTVIVFMLIAALRLTTANLSAAFLNQSLTNNQRRKSNILQPHMQFFFPLLMSVCMSAMCSLFTHEAETLSCRPLSVPHPERSCPTLGWGTSAGWRWGTWRRSVPPCWHRCCCPPAPTPSRSRTPSTTPVSCFITLFVRPLASQILGRSWWFVVRGAAA